MIRQSGLSGNRKKWLSGLTDRPSACARYASRTIWMHSLRWARTMSNTVLPLMIDSSKCMASPLLLESGRPRGIEDRVEVGHAAVRAQEQHGGVLVRRHPRRIPLDRREHCAAGPAHEQSLGREEFPARFNGLALGYQDNVVNLGMRQQRRDDARSNAGNMALARCPTEDDGAFSIDGDDPNVGIALFESTRHSGDRSRRADGDEHIIKRGKIGADLSPRELVVRLYGVRISVLVRPVGVRNGGTQLLHLLKAGLQESAGVVTLLDLHHRGTDPPEARPVRARAIGVDHRDEPQADQVSEGCESGGEVPRGGLDHRCLFANLASLGRPLEDPVGGAVLDAPNRVDILELCKKIHSLHSQLHIWSG